MHHQVLAAPTSECIIKGALHGFCILLCVHVLFNKDRPEPALHGTLLVFIAAWRENVICPCQAAVGAKDLWQWWDSSVPAHTAHKVALSSQVKHANKQATHL